MGPKDWKALQYTGVARTLYEKYICKNHILETDFTTPEKKRLNRGAVSCTRGG